MSPALLCFNSKQGKNDVNLVLLVSKENPASFILRQSIIQSTDNRRFQGMRGNSTQRACGSTAHLNELAERMSMTVSYAKPGDDACQVEHTK